MENHPLAGDIRPVRVVKIHFLPNMGPHLLVEVAEEGSEEMASATAVDNSDRLHLNMEHLPAQEVWEEDMEEAMALAAMMDNLGRLHPNMEHLLAD